MSIDVSSIDRSTIAVVIIVDVIQLHTIDQIPKNLIANFSTRRGADYLLLLLIIKIYISRTEICN